MFQHEDGEDVDFGTICEGIILVQLFAVSNPNAQEEVQP